MPSSRRPAESKRRKASPTPTPRAAATASGDDLESERVAGLPGAGPRWQRRKTERPQEILSAARDLFLQQGFRETRMIDVARHAGVRPGTLYVYYRNKEALLEAVVKEAVAPAIAFAEQRLQGRHDSAAALLKELMLGWWHEFGATPASSVLWLMVAEAAHFPEMAQLLVEEVQVRARRICVTVLKRGMASGEFRRIDAEQVALVLMAPLTWASVHRASLAPFDPGFSDLPRYLETHLDIVLYGLFAQPSRAGAKAAHGGV